MSLLSDLTAIANTLDFPVETGVFSDTPPDLYLVLTPLSDIFDLHADNSPGVDVQEVRISLFCKGKYTTPKSALLRALIAADLTITGRQYIGHEDDTGYHHYAIDVANFYEMEE